MTVSTRIDCAQFFQNLTALGIRFYAGVPDSLLKNICAYITDHVDATHHLITPNEGNAVALAAGHYLATGDIPLVYMQNSGLGNAVNPLTSLSDPEVYAIPMLLLIGWRGQPGVKDEPQHVKMGRINPAVLETLEIPQAVLSADWQTAQQQLQTAVRTIRETSAPYALLVPDGVFENYKLQHAPEAITNGLSREAAIEIAATHLPPEAVVVATTGKISRELYEVRERQSQGHARDFLTVGSMGHASQIALGIALSQPGRPVFCFDGDGAVLMHMGALAAVGSSGCKNLVHIVFNNWAHESVGGQPTVGDRIHLPRIAEACGYQAAYRAHSGEELKSMLALAETEEGPVLLEVLVEKGSRADLARPKEKPVENKRLFMQTLGVSTDGTH